MNTKLKAIAIAFVIACSASMASAKMPRNIFAPDPVFSMSNMIFADTLALNQSVTKTIYANAPYNWTGIKVLNGQTFKFTVGSPEWNNGPIETDAAGYTQPPAIEAASCPRRYPSYRWMALMGELYSANQAPTTYMSGFNIGMGRNWKANSTGFFSAMANDCLIAYGDNSRVVTLTIKRVG